MRNEEERAAKTGGPTTGSRPRPRRRRNCGRRRGRQDAAAAETETKPAAGGRNEGAETKPGPAAHGSETGDGSRNRKDRGRAGAAAGNEREELLAELLETAARAVRRGTLEPRTRWRIADLLANFTGRLDDPEG